MNNIDTTPATATAIANNEPIVATADSPVNSATLKTPVVLGIDIGGTNSGVAWSTLSVHSSIPAAVRRISSGRSYDQASIISKAILPKCSMANELKAISVGFPSVVDATRTVVLQTTFIPGLNNVNVPERLSRFGVPVFIDRDVNMIIRYDAKRLNLQNLEGVTFGCYVGTGIGCALAVDGKILAGLHGVAGELGHIYEATGRTCGCGLEGCSETAASGNALVRELEAHHPGASIDDAFSEYGDEQFIDDWLEHLAWTFSPSSICEKSSSMATVMKGFQAAARRENQAHVRKPPGRGSADRLHHPW
ncbi:MAG: ROK family protein [Bifidobacterium dentium]